MGCVVTQESADPWINW